MQVGSIDLKEPILWNESIKLVILRDENVIYHALELSVDQEQEARVESGVPVHTTPLVYFNLSIIVDISNSSGDSVILSNSAI